MTKWAIVYTRIPTNYNPARRAVIEAETAADALAILKDALGEPGASHLTNYVFDKPTEYVPPPAGRVVTLSESGL